VAVAVAVAWFLVQLLAKSKAKMVVIKAYFEAVDFC